MSRGRMSLVAVGMLWGGLGLSLCQAEEVSPSDITVAELKTVIEFLASDTLQGRDAGAEGGRAAAAFLANEFRTIGLAPHRDEDYRQPFGIGYQNIIAILPGTDPALATEQIVLGAHYDHVGFGNRTNSFGPFGQIHNGADDNASGVACLLEIAEALKHGPPRRRPVVVALWDAEERGLLGSEHWMQSTVNASAVKFYVNFDMVGRMRDDRVSLFGIRTAPQLRSLAVAANQSDLQFEYDWSQRDDSDHYSFYRRRVPYLMPFTGMHGDYHRPSDDLDKLNYEGIRRVAILMTRCVTELANTETPGALDFREASRREVVASLPREALPVRLGVSWSPNLAVGEPLTITQVEPDLPAAQAGWQVGDIVQSVNHVPVGSHADFMDLTRVAPPHSEFEIKRARDGEVVSIAMKLNGWPLPRGVRAARDPADPEVPVFIEVAPDSEGSRLGVMPGDRLMGVEEGVGEPTVRRWHIERAGRLQWLPPDPPFPEATRPEPDPPTEPVVPAAAPAP